MAEEKEQATSSRKPNKWAGITRGEYKPHRFLHRQKEYVWENLTREEIEQLADDPSFILFQRKH